MICWLTGEELLKALSLRKLEYLQIIRINNVLLFGEILRSCKNKILGPNNSSIDTEGIRTVFLFLFIFFFHKEILSI